MEKKITGGVTREFRESEIYQELAKEQKAQRAVLLTNKGVSVYKADPERVRHVISLWRQENARNRKR